MLVTGDPHVQRMYKDVSYLLDSRLDSREIEVFFLYWGAAKLNHVLNNINTARGYDVLVTTAGGNNLSSGAG